MRLLTPAAGLLASASLLATEEPPPAPPSPPATTGVPAEPEPLRQWLEEVRAQRRAWEERRRATKEAFDARRRWMDPWGAAEKEARDKENQRRREELMEHIERERGAFRAGTPRWGNPPPPWQEAPRSEAPPEPSGDAPAAQEGEPGSEPPALPPPYPPLPGWDNRWYYRGY
jgi:hypothetical protein